MSFSVRRLEPADAKSFQALRQEGFLLHDRKFRYAPDDEADIGLGEVEGRMRRDYVAGLFANDQMIGIAGLTRQEGLKTRHKALLWGMYVRREYRGSGAADILMSQIIERARDQFELVNLTVVHENHRAVRFYRRWGFVTYGVEPRSIKLADGTYLDEALMSRSFEQRI